MLSLIKLFSTFANGKRTKTDNFDKLMKIKVVQNVKLLFLQFRKSFPICELQRYYRQP